jgi:SAM-dependent methyltransferase
VAARYDGFASWYEEHTGPYTAAASSVVQRLLGRGPGRCLDLCCGTGVHLGALLALGWEVTGADISADQLLVARGRAEGRVELVQADAAALPFADADFDAVVSLFSHTDVDDFSAAVGEAARVLRPGGTFIYVGIHPCFVGPHSSYWDDREVPELHSGYAEQGRYQEGPGIRPDGLWARVAGVHLPLAVLLKPFLDAPLRLDAIEEHGDENDAYPRRIALRARREA